MQVRGRVWVWLREGEGEGLGLSLGLVLGLGLPHLGIDVEDGSVPDRVQVGQPLRRRGALDPLPARRVRHVRRARLPEPAVPALERPVHRRTRSAEGERLPPPLRLWRGRVALRRRRLREPDAGAAAGCGLRTEEVDVPQRLVAVGGCGEAVHLGEVSRCSPRVQSAGAVGRCSQHAVSRWHCVMHNVMRLGELVRQLALRPRHWREAVAPLARADEGVAQYL